MDLSSLTVTPGSRPTAKRVGRGCSSGMGRTCGKGTKGQMARKGHKRKIGHEGGQMPLFRRLPKRGFKNVNHAPFTCLNLSALNKFEDGATVDPLAMLEAGLVKQVAKGGVKILGTGTLTKKLNVKASAFSASAKEKIEALGGTCENV